MAIKKNELYSSLWASCDKLRGGMDASQYKDYILTLLFVKYQEFLLLKDSESKDPSRLIISMRNELKLSNKKNKKQDTKV